MGLNVSTESNEYEKVTSGNHTAICVGVVDLGIQPKWEGGEGRDRAMVCLVFEIGDELQSDGSPFTYSLMFTQSLHEKAKLRKTLEQWRNKPFSADEMEVFNLASLIGAPCELSMGPKIGSDGKERIVINNITYFNPKRGIPKPEAKSQLILFDTDSATALEFDLLPEWLQKKLKQAVNWPEIENRMLSEQAEPAPF